jgi:hypothetical protein
MTAKGQTMITSISRICRLTAGFSLLVVGAVLALPGVPGPGIPIMLLGLWLLSRHFTWARRAFEWGKHKLALLQQKRTREFR